MVDTPQDIHVEIEADAGSATRSAKAVADELTRVVSSVAQLEAKLRDILQGKLPKQMQDFAKFLQTTQNLPANITQGTRQARVLASGGPATQFNRAAVQGVIANIRNDPAFQSLQIEKELNRVLESRATIYARVRNAMPDGATERQRTSVYREALGSLGDAGNDKTYMQRTLNEVRQFENDRVALAQQANLQLARVEAEAENKARDRRAAAAMRRLRAEAEEDNKLYNQKQAALARRDRSDAEAQNRSYDRSQTRSYAQMRAEADKENKQRSAPTRQQRAQAGLQAVQDRFNVNGGAGMFEVQATILRNYATMGAVLGTLSYAAGSVKDLQASLKDVQAIAAATDGEMAKLSSTIFEVGKNSKLSTGEIAEGAKVLAQAGYSVQQIQEMIKPITDLAVGSGSSLADAAAVTTSVLQVFDLSISRTAEVTNTLVAGLNQSKLSMEQLSLGIQYAGNIASSGGVQFDEMVAALGAMANAGIKSGSTLGTGLRSVILALDSPTQKLRQELEKLHLTEEDVNVRTHGLAEVMKTLKNAGFDSSAAMQSMEVRAAAAYTALSNNLGVYETMEKNIVGTTAAQKAAETQMDSFAAQWQRLLNSVTAAATVMGGPVLRTLTLLVGGFAGALAAATPLAPVIQVVAAALAALVAINVTKYLAGLIAGLAGGTSSLAGFSVAAVMAARTTEELVVALGALSAELVIPAVIAGLILMISSLGDANAAQNKLNQQLDQFKSSANQAKASGDEYQQRVKEIDKYVETLSNRHSALSTNIAAAGAEADRAQGRFGAWGLQLDANGKTVDQLIGKLVVLRGQMAAVAHQKSLDERSELNKARDALNSAATNQRNTVQSVASNLASLPRQQQKLSATELAAVQALSKGGLSLDQILPNAAILRNAKLRLDAQGNSGWTGQRLDQLLGTLAPLQNTAVEQRENDAKLQQNSETIATTGISMSAQGGGAYQSVTKQLNEWRDAQFKINQERDPQKKLAAQKAFDAVKAQQMPALQAQLQASAKALANDPQIASGLRDRAAMNGTSLDAEIQNQFVTDIPGLSKLMAMSDRPDQMDEGALKDRAKALEEEALTARKGGDTKTYQAKRAQAREFRTKAAYAKFMKTGDYDASEVDDRVSDVQTAFDEQTKRGLMGSAGQGRNSGRRTAQADVKSLERQIEIAMGNGGPDAAGIKAQQPLLEGLLNKWEEASKKAIRLNGSNADDIQAQLDDFQTKAKEYRNQVLGGNLQAALDLLAKQAGETSARTAATAAADVRAGKVPLNEAIANISAGFDDFLQKTMDAADQAIRKEGLDPATSAKLAEDRKAKLREIVGQASAAINDALTAANARIHDQLRVQELADAGRRSRVDALSNFYGTRNVSDVQRYLATTFEGHDLDVNAAKRNVRGAKADYDQAVGQEAVARSADRRLGTEQSGKDLAAAAANTRSMEQSLEGAEQSLQALTAESKTFSSVSEAIAASWKAYADQSRISMPFLSQLADGMTGVFDAGRQSFATFLTDISSGTMTAGGAIKKFTVSILQSFQDMAAKMVADKLLMWALNMIVGAFTGGAGANLTADFAARAPGSFSPSGMKMGGRVPKRLTQGSPAPFRDSVHTLLQPGEFVMSQTAASMVGYDKLEQMNAMGNRRVSSMPTLAQAMPAREPDTANVYVVAPEAKPQMGPKDVIAVITDDMLTGGKTKKLIRAIQMGAA